MRTNAGPVQASLIVPALSLALLLSGCTAPVAGEDSDPASDLQQVIDLIPWAKSVAADADANVVAERIEQITAGLPTLDIAPATRAELERRLVQLGDAVRQDPSDAAAHVTELNAILAELAAAL